MNKWRHHSTRRDNSHAFFVVLAGSGPLRVLGPVIGQAAKYEQAFKGVERSEPLRLDIKRVDQWAVERESS